MKKSIYFVTVLIVSLFSACLPKGEKQDKVKPNIIFILADDLGYGELGCYGQELIETPNIDRLAADGMKFSQHYSGSPVCAPSRCVLMTGLHSGHAFVRSNISGNPDEKHWDYRAVIADSTLEGQVSIPSNTVTIGKLLQSAGYKTGMIGKWGLGQPQTDGIPNKQGFDFFCGYICQSMAHTYYPVHLYKNEHRLHLDNDTVAPHTRLDPTADPFDTESYSKYQLNEYAPDVMFSEMINFVEDNKDNPFFLYWASPIPHVPLQAPAHWVNYYVEKFGDEEPYIGDNTNYCYFPCRYPHATYAAMISYLDERVGELVQTLKDNGIYDNTLIIFTSDNGSTYNGGTDGPWFNSGGPFKCEKGWAKGYLHEGGIRIPMIASWPGRIHPGTNSDLVSAFQDVLPTLCEVTGVKIPDNIDGISYLPELLGDKDQNRHEYLYWEFPGYNGQQAVRIGQWKGIRKDIQKGKLEIELYDLNNDIEEQHNVANQHPDIIRQMEQIMKNEHKSSELNDFRMKALGDIIE